MASSATDPAVLAKANQSSVLDQKMSDNPAGKWGMVVFTVLLIGGVIYSPRS